MKRSIAIRCTPVLGNPLGGETERGQVGRPSLRGGAVAALAGGQVLAQLGERVFQVFRSHIEAVRIFHHDLLLDQGARYQPLQSLGAREIDAVADGQETEDSRLEIQIARQDHLVIDDGNDAVQRLSFLSFLSFLNIRRRCIRGRGVSLRAGRCGAAVQLEQRSGNGQGNDHVRPHQKLCPRLKKKLKCAPSPTYGLVRFIFVTVL